jgi:hypothetical protein
LPEKIGNKIGSTGIIILSDARHEPTWSNALSNCLIAIPDQPEIARNPPFSE